MTWNHRLMANKFSPKPKTLKILIYASSELRFMSFPPFYDATVYIILKEFSCCVDICDRKWGEKHRIFQLDIFTNLTFAPRNNVLRNLK